MIFYMIDHLQYLNSFQVEGGVHDNVIFNDNDNDDNLLQVEGVRAAQQSRQGRHQHCQQQGGYY